ncbi:MAG TPA: hypothetical protein VFL93_01840, partial [Longimicrobiaceae bacterium]|nr:hypothetical protein [Longimicrobiaceae bacterium]
LLVQEDSVRVVLVALGAGMAMPAHAVSGPAVVQALRGDVVLRAGPESWRMQAGGVLVLAPELEHSVETAGGCVLLVVIHGGGSLGMKGPVG